MLTAGAARAFSLLVSFTLMMLVTWAPTVLAGGHGRAPHGLVLLVSWGLVAGFVHGVGFVPRGKWLRFFLGPWLAWPLLFVGLLPYARLVLH